jgi:hypothetical protein
MAAGSGLVSKQPWACASEPRWRQELLAVLVLVSGAQWAKTLAAQLATDLGMQSGAP